MRALDQIDKVRREKGFEGLRDQVEWRLELLGGTADLTSKEGRAAFDDLVDAFAPEGYHIVLDPNARCVATLDRGGEIEFQGTFITGGTIAGTLSRELSLAKNRAYHRNLRIHPMYRGNRIAPRSLIKSVVLYDALGIDHIRVRAAWSGTWFWALWGFHFEDAGERRRVHAHAQRLVDAFGGGLDTSTFVHPLQFARLGEPELLSFNQLADMFPEARDKLEEIADANGLGIHEQIPFGRVVLLTAPSWWGRLDLTGGDRLIFDDRARHTLAEVQEAS